MGVGGGAGEQAPGEGQGGEAHGGVPAGQALPSGGVVAQQSLQGIHWRGGGDTRMAALLNLEAVVA